MPLLDDVTDAVVPHAAVAVTAEDKEVETMLGRVIAYGARGIPVLDDLQAQPGPRRSRHAVCDLCEQPLGIVPSLGQIPGTVLAGLAVRHTIKDSERDDMRCPVSGERRGGTQRRRSASGAIPSDEHPPERCGRDRPGPITRPRPAFAIMPASSRHGHCDRRH